MPPPIPGNEPPPVPSLAPPPLPAPPTLEALLAARVFDENILVAAAAPALPSASPPTLKKFVETIASEYDPARRGSTTSVESSARQGSPQGRASFALSQSKPIQISPRGSIDHTFKQSPADNILPSPGFAVPVPSLIPPLRIPSTSALLKAGIARRGSSGISPQTESRSIEPIRQQAGLPQSQGKHSRNHSLTDDIVPVIGSPPVTPTKGSAPRKLSLDGSDDRGKRQGEITSGESVDSPSQLIDTFEETFV